MIELSIIIVNYKVKDRLLSCVESIKNANVKINYEIIVVDNDEVNVLEKDLKKLLPLVRYFKTEKNLGFGGGNNFGAKFAKGKYLFFLNPDTKIFKNTIESLLSFLKKDNNIAVVAPLLFDQHNKVYPLQGSRELNPISAIFSLSILQRFFPKNPIYKNYYLFDWNKKDSIKVDVVPGTAFMIKKSIFEEVGKFDEKFFLYFEESDLCKRIRVENYNIYINPDAKVMHLWGESTKNSDKNIPEIFIKSRDYYFKKNYGPLLGIITNWILAISKVDLLFFLIFILGIFLRFFKLKENFYFDGEVGDNLLDIKNAYIHNIIPLSGPPTSHPWLSFGPLFYWIYEPFWILAKFNPLSYAYFGAFFASVITLINYIFIKKLFNKKIAFISSFLIVVSPLFLEFSRWARFFSLIPALVPIFLYCISKTNKNKKYLFFAGIALGTMLNFHYTPLMLVPAVISFFLIKKVFLSLKQIIFFIIGFLLPMTPFLIYDSLHKFAMTINLFLWIPYRIFGFLGIYHKNTISTKIINENVISFWQFFSSVFINPNLSVGIFIFLILGFYSIFKIWKETKKEKINWNVILIILWGFWGLIAVFIHGSPPPHYFVPILSFPLILASMLMFDVWKKVPYGKFIVFILLIIVLISNFLYFFSKDWFFAYKNEQFPYIDRVQVAKTIVKDASGKSYMLKRIGYNDQFEKNYAQNYIYLLWYFGNQPVNKSDILYTIVDGKDKFFRNIKKNESIVFIKNNIAIIKSTR